MKNVVSRLLLVMCLFLVSICIGGYVHADMNQQIKVMVNGKYLSLEQPAVYKNGRVMVPMRAVSEALKATIKFQSTEKPIVIKSGSSEISFTLGQKTAYINGKQVTLDVPPQTINNTAMVPSRFISESFNADVVWKDAWRIVAIESKHAANEIIITQTDALQKVKGLAGNETAVSNQGTELLRFYSFHASTNEYDFDFNYFVDKYTAKVYSFYFDGTLTEESGASATVQTTSTKLTKDQALNLLRSRINPIFESLKKSPNILDYETTVTIDNVKCYSFDVFFVGASNPYYYVTTAYVSLDGKHVYMLNAQDEVVTFTDKLFTQYLKNTAK